MYHSNENSKFLPSTGQHAHLVHLCSRFGLSSNVRFEFIIILREFFSIVHLKDAPVLLFISLVGFYKCIFGANVIDFEIFKTLVEIIF